MQLRRAKESVGQCTCGSLSCYIACGLLTKASQATENLDRLVSGTIQSYSSSLRCLVWCSPGCNIPSAGEFCGNGRNMFAKLQELSGKPVSAC